MTNRNPFPSLGILIPLIFLLLPACGEAPQAIPPQAGRTIAKGITSPGPMALDRRGNLYLIDHTSSRIDIVMADGSRTTLAENLNQPGDLAVDSQGRVLVSETGSGAIRCIHPDGTSQIVAHGLNGPTSLTLDRDGGLFVSCRGDGRIVKIPPARYL